MDLVLLDHIEAEISVEKLAGALCLGAYRKNFFDSLKRLV